VALFPAKDALHPAIEVKNECEMFSRFELAQNCGRTIFFLRQFLFHTSREILIKQVGVQKSSVFSEKSNLARNSGN
jgi:hypothetical protein